jgi:hypothetical protein
MTATPAQDQGMGCWLKGGLIALVIVGIAIGLIIFMVIKVLDEMRNVQLAAPSQQSCCAIPKTK